MDGAVCVESKLFKAGEVQARAAAVLHGSHAHLAGVGVAHESPKQRSWDSGNYISHALK